MAISAEEVSQSSKTLNVTDIFRGNEDPDYALLGEAVLYAFNETFSGGSDEKSDQYWDRMKRDQPLRIPLELEEKVIQAKDLAVTSLDYKLCLMLGQDAYSIIDTKIDGSLHLPVSRPVIEKMIEKAKKKLHDQEYPNEDAANTRRRLFEGALPNIDRVLMNFLENDKSDATTIVPLAFLHELSNRAVQVLRALESSKDLEGRFEKRELRQRFGFVESWLRGLSKEQVGVVQARALQQLDDIKSVFVALTMTEDSFISSNVFKKQHDLDYFLTLRNEREDHWNSRYSSEHGNVPMSLVKDYFSATETADFVEKNFAPENILHNNELNRLYGGLQHFTLFAMYSVESSPLNKDFVLAAVAMGYDPYVSYAMYEHMKDRRSTALYPFDYEKILNNARKMREQSKREHLNVKNPKHWDDIFGTDEEQVED